MRMCDEQWYSLQLMMAEFEDTLTQTHIHTQLGETKRNNGTSHSFNSSRQECKGFAAAPVTLRNCDVKCVCVNMFLFASRRADESADVLLLEVLQHLCSSVQNLERTQTCRLTLFISPALTNAPFINAYLAPITIITPLNLTRRDLMFSASHQRFNELAPQKSPRWCTPYNTSLCASETVAVDGRLCAVHGSHVCFCPFISVCVYVCVCLHTAGYMGVYVPMLLCCGLGAVSLWELSCLHASIAPLFIKLCANSLDGSVCVCRVCAYILLFVYFSMHMCAYCA